MRRPMRALSKNVVDGGSCRGPAEDAATPVAFCRDAILDVQRDYLRPETAPSLHPGLGTPLRPCSQALPQGRRRGLGARQVRERADVLRRRVPPLLQAHFS